MKNTKQQKYKLALLQMAIQETRSDFNKLSVKEQQIVLEQQGGLVGAVGQGIKAVGQALFGGRAGSANAGPLTALSDLMFGAGKGTPQQVKTLRTLMSAVRSHMNGVVRAFLTSSFEPFKTIGKQLQAVRKTNETNFASNDPKKIKLALEQSLTIQAYMDAFQNFGEDFSNIVESHEEEIASGNNEKIEEVIKLVEQTILRDLGAANYKNLGNWGRFGQTLGLKIAKVPPGLTPADISKTITNHLRSQIKEESEEGVTSESLIRKRSNANNVFKKTLLEWKLLRRNILLKTIISEALLEAASEGGIKQAFDELVKATQAITKPLQTSETNAGAYGAQTAAAAAKQDAVAGGAPGASGNKPATPQQGGGAQAVQQPSGGQPQTAGSPGAPAGGPQAAGAAQGGETEKKPDIAVFKGAGTSFQSKIAKAINADATLKPQAGALQKQASTVINALANDLKATKQFNVLEEKKIQLQLPTTVQALRAIKDNKFKEIIRKELVGLLRANKLSVSDKVLSGAPVEVEAPDTSSGTVSAGATDSSAATAKPADSGAAASAPASGNNEQQNSDTTGGVDASANPAASSGGLAAPAATGGENAGTTGAVDPAIKQALDTIGAKEGDPPAEVKKKFQAAISANHPDRNQNSPESNQKTAQINAAAETLRKANLMEEMKRNLQLSKKLLYLGFITESEYLATLFKSKKSLQKLNESR